MTLLRRSFIDRPVATAQCLHARNAPLRLRNPAGRTYTRPAFAPKPIIDIKHIRQNPGLYEQNCIDRNYAAHSKSSWRIIELHEQWLALQQSARSLRARNNQLRALLSKGASRMKEADGAKEVPMKQGVIEEAKALKTQLSAIEAQETWLQDEIEGLAQDLPNLSSVHTPVGTKADVTGYINQDGLEGALGSNKVGKSHVDIGQELGILDFSGSAQTSGWGWYFLVGDGAMLEQALVQYALSVARGKGWKAVAPPSLVYSHIASACGFQPRDQNGEQQIYAVEQSEKDKSKPQLALAGTAEIPLAGMKANQTLEDSQLPLKTVGVSRCYRAEAGARGADTKGLYRVHEFTKVEMFAWTLPDNAGDDHFTPSSTPSSGTIFEEMLSIQKEVLKSLGLHCRILEMSTTDLGASATRKVDMEALFPSRKEKDEGWGEVTSTSMCTDYQSRRLHTRARISGKLEFPHTLNGTALAVPRVLAAILEHHWNDEEGTVTIPEVLRPFMGGQEKIEKS
ncbi:seryl-tRNA synthetase [Ophiobolus disseminans]|uniref:serine--tRNA ligase n=1 Tax=Ophiobolus disseminans TaxID=1469910 RepID=A0A6A7ADE5_9PLEO|nr:seryl-tRNA synthetase [Ophiobolus disseminans]